MKDLNTPTESARLWEPGLPGIELFVANLYRKKYKKHFHEAYTIGFNESGQGHCEFSGTRHVQYPGSFNLINPGDIHTGQVTSVEKGWAFRNLYISLPLITHTLHQLDFSGPGMPYFKVPILQASHLRPCFYLLFNSVSESTSRLTQQSLLLELLSGLFRINAETPIKLRPPKPESKAIKRVRTYLEDHYNHNISIDEVAQLVNLNPYYLIRCFRQQVGCAPHQYQQHWQVLQAKRALQTSTPLSTIAIDHGFYDQSHLNRAFKQTFGVTPGQYQKVNSVQYGQR